MVISQSGLGHGDRSSRVLPLTPSLDQRASKDNSWIQPERHASELQLPSKLSGTLTKLDKPASSSSASESGNYAQIIKGVLERPDGSKTEVAIESIRRVGGIDKQSFKKRVRREASIWMTVNHPNILEFIGYKMVDGAYCLVSPWCQHRTLAGYIAKTRGIRDSKKLKLLCDAARGVAHLHSLTPRIAHGSIHPEHVFIKDNLEAALGNFRVSAIFVGIERAGGGATTSDILEGAAGYRAKELFQDNAPPASAAGDVYAFGGLILAVMSGENPFYNRRNDASRIVAVCMGQIPSPQYHPRLPRDDPLWNLLKECWSENPEQRPTMNIVLKKLETVRNGRLFVEEAKEREAQSQRSKRSKKQRELREWEREKPLEWESEMEENMVPRAKVVSQLLARRTPELPGSLKKVQHLVTTDEKTYSEVAGGAFLDGFQGVYERPDGTTLDVAIKCIKRVYGLRQRVLLVRVIRETFVWKTVEHPNVLEFVGYQIVEGKPWLVSPFCRHRSLSHYIANNPGIRDSEKLKLVCDAARGLAHLHSLAPVIVHGSIKPENVLVKDNLEAALCDLGVSRISLDTGTACSTSASSAGYQAKEILDDDHPTTAADVYAFGGLILATMSEKAPFWEKSDTAKLLAVAYDLTPMPCNHPRLPEADPLWGLLRRCWRRNPAARPIAETVLKKLELESESRYHVLASKIPQPLSETSTWTGELIARGGSGDVYRGSWKVPGEPAKQVVIKCLVFARDQKREYLETRVKREATIWKIATHPNVLPFIGYQILDHEARLVSPWCENGDLETYIHMNPELARNDKLKLVCGAARGLCYLHSRDPPIFHGDIKPPNVIVQDNLEAALCDFGISKVILDAGKHSGLTTAGNFSGTLGYQPKEILDEGPPTTAADVYGFGGLILATMSEKPPFWKKKRLEKLLAIVHDQTPSPEDHPQLFEEDPLWVLLRECWSGVPASRPSMSEVLERVEAQIAAQ